jgi:plasmid maintenance system killer protein
LRNIVLPEFWQRVAQFPAQIQKQTKEVLDFCARHDSATVRKSAYRLKLVNRKTGIWSIRINQNYRALLRIDADGSYLWYWAGPHDEYVKRIK